MPSGLIVRVWDCFPKISKAMEGLREAHMDVLVAVFGKQSHTLTNSQPRRLLTIRPSHSPKALQPLE